MSSQVYRMARVADASRWRTSSQAYGAFYKLPPRESVKDPQHSLLAALAPAVEPPSAAADSQGFVLQARVVPQPGDGACLFHSLADGHQAEPLRLRHAIADFIESQPDATICGEPLRAWVKWESRLPPALYAARMRGADCWGGAIEIAVRRASRSRTPCMHAAHPMPHGVCSCCTRARSAQVFARLFGVAVYVYEPLAAAGSFQRIASFQPPHETEQQAHLLYRGGVHYDALHPT